MMRKINYKVADHKFAIYGEELCSMIQQISGFRPFEDEDSQEDFKVTLDDNLPDSYKVQYSFDYEEILGEFGATENGFFLRQTPAGEEPFVMWTKEGDNTIYMNGNNSIRLFRFALWVGYGLMTCAKATIAIHSSCILSQGGATIFLGESGTGKSTHTRLWRENIADAVLLNDDSPIVRVIDGEAWVYGSPWSGKTPCYKQERHPLKACVRLSQAPYNKIHKLHVIKGYAALHPSCPPEFAYDEKLYKHISATLGAMLKKVKCYWLECLPNADAAHLSHSTIFAE